MIDEALTTLLNSVTEELLGGRVFPSTETDPDDKRLPRLLYTLISDPPDYCDDGRTLDNALYQIDVFADLMTGAKAVTRRLQAPANAADPAKRGLDGFSGTEGTTEIHRISFPGGQHVESGTINDGEEKTVARVVLELRVVFRELDDPA